MGLQPRKRSFTNGPKSFVNENFARPTWEDGFLSGLPGFVFLGEELGLASEARKPSKQAVCAVGEAFGFVDEAVFGLAKGFGGALRLRCARPAPKGPSMHPSPSMPLAIDAPRRRLSPRLLPTPMLSLELDL